MERSWMQLTNRTDPEYQKGVQEFLQCAFNRAKPVSKTRCPCIKCYNYYIRTREEVEDHLLKHGIVKNYVKWTHHGEYTKHESDDEDDEDDDNYEDMVDYEVDDELKGMVIDLATTVFGDFSGGNESRGSFAKLLRDAQRVHPGSEKSSVSFVVELLHIQFVGRMSNESIDMFIKLVKEMLPTGETFPGSYDDAKKMVQDFHSQVVKERNRSAKNKPAPPSW